MSIETEKNSCPCCSTQLEYCYINLTEKMLICTEKKCLFPFDIDDVSPYVIKVDSLIEKERVVGPSSSSLLGDTLFSSKKSKPSLDLNESSSTQSKNTFTKSSDTESSPSSLGLSSVESYNISRNSADSKPLANLTTQSLTRSNKKFLDSSNKTASDFPENSTSNSNNSITLKTLGVTLKIDPTDKNKLQPNSSQGSSTDLTNSSSSISLSNSTESDLVSLFDMNDFPTPAVEGSSSLVNTAGNGLLEVNATGESDNGNFLTVGEYTRILFGQSDIDINLDSLPLNSDIMDISTQGNNTSMELDEILGTFDPLESGNNMDFDSLMANLDSNFTEAGIFNVSGNDLNVDLNSILVNVNGDIIGSVNSNEVQNNGVNENSDIYAGVANGKIINVENNNVTIVDSTLENVNEKTTNGENNVKRNANVMEEGKNVGETFNGDSITLMNGI